MGYSNSPLVTYTKLSPNHSGTRTHAIDTITIHCVVGQLSAAGICGCFTSPSRQASCNYGIGKDGDIGLCVEEKNRSWCTSSNANDQRAITIETASDTTHPYAVTDKAYNSLINLVADICKRNGIKKLVWSTDKNKRMNHLNGCNMTVHRDYANKACPGDFLYNRMGDIAAKVNAKLGSGSTGGSSTSKPQTSSEIYRVRKSWNDEKSQTGAYNVLENAKKDCDKHPGYSVFDKNGKTVYTSGGSADIIYVVKAGDTLSKIAEKYGMDYKELAKYNGISNPNIIHVGQKIKIPQTGGSVLKKSAQEIAKEVISGTCSDSRWSSWGNGAERKKRLEAAGYNYNEVQNRINKMM